MHRTSRPSVSPSARALALGLAVGLALAVAVACSSATITTTSAPGSTPLGSTPSGSTPSHSAPTDPTTAGPAPALGDPMHEPGALYLAVLRSSLGRSASDPAPGGPPPYARIVVIDHAMPDAASPDGTSGPGAPFGETTRHTIEAGLADLGPVEWAPPDHGLSVHSGSGREEVQVVLGPVTPAGVQYHVGMSKTCGPMCGSGDTQVVEARGETWVVVGSTGPSWMS
jgi:hypothetical protein